MEELITKYRKRLRDLKKEFKEHRETDEYRTYLYGKILAYELVVKDLMVLRRQTNEMG